MATNQEKNKEQRSPNENTPMEQRGRSGETEKTAGTRQDDERAKKSRALDDEDEDQTTDTQRKENRENQGGNRGGNQGNR